MGTCKISISGNGINIEQGISEELAKELAVIVLTRGSLDTQKENKAGFNDDIEKNSKVYIASLKNKFISFVKDHNANRACELVACAGVFLEKNGQPTFTKKEYREMFAHVRGKPSTNAPADLKWATNSNWVNCIGDDQYKVTSIGKKVVREKFPNTVKGSTRRMK